MTFIDTDPVRVTVRTPERRLDVALPADVPVSALLPVLLRHGGSDLAGLGAAHGGWVLRRLDGTPVSSDADLATQNVRHGAELRLGLADEWWPALDYDDVAAAVAGTPRGGRRWSRNATRVTAVVVAALLLGIGLVSTVAAGPPRSAPAGVAAIIAVVLLAVAVVTARGYRDRAIAVAVGAMALPYGFVAALLAAGPDHTRPLDLIDPMSLSLGGAALAVLAMIAVIGVGWRPPALVAGIAIGLLVIVGALVWATLTGDDTKTTGAAGAAAVILGILVLTYGLVPSIAIRAGGLPRLQPVDGGEARDQSHREATTETSGRGDDDAAIAMAPLVGAVARTDDAITGLLIAVAVAAGMSAVVLVIAGGRAGWWLTATAAAGFAVRSRIFPAVRHRVAAIVAAALPSSVLLISLAHVGTRLTVGLAGTALAMIAVSTARRSPYRARLADVLEIACIAATVPLVCVILGLYGEVRGWHA